MGRGAAGMGRGGAGFGGGVMGRGGGFGRGGGRGGGGFGGRGHHHGRGGHGGWWSGTGGGSGWWYPPLYDDFYGYRRGCPYAGSCPYADSCLPRGATVSVLFPNDACSLGSTPDDVNASLESIYDEMNCCNGTCRMTARCRTDSLVVSTKFVSKIFLGVRVCVGCARRNHVDEFHILHSCVVRCGYFHGTSVCAR
jgi:hypothetical protein